MKIALFQMNIIWEDKEKNYKKAEKELDNLKNNNVELLLLPEMSFTGFSMNTEKTKESNLETVNMVKSWALKYKLSIGFGWVKDNGGKCENHYTIINKDGNMISDYIKIHPFSFGGESDFFIGGEKVIVSKIEDVTFSTFICYDLRFPEIFQCASKQADMIIVPANWPQARSSHWKNLLKARAIENQVYMVGINCVGVINGQEYSGDSCIINPDGEIVKAVSFEEEVLEFNIRYDVYEFRDRFPFKRDRRDFLYSRL